MEGKKQLAGYFETNFPLNTAGLEELIAAFRERQYARNTLLLRQEDREDALRFLTRGTVREFYKNEDREININFYVTSQFINDFSSFMQGGPTRKYQECLSEVSVLELGRDRFSDLLERYSCGQSFIEATFQKLLKEKEVSEYRRMTKTPEVLYRELRQHKPHWLKAIPQYHIASYLGIAPETLSRIRKKTS